MAVGLPPALGNSLCKKSLKYFSYSEALLVEGYQNGARQHLALRQLLISLVPLRSVISRWVINESSADSVTDNSSCCPLSNALRQFATLLSGGSSSSVRLS